MTLIDDHNDIEFCLISNKLLNSVQLKLPTVPVEFLQIEFDENLKVNILQVGIDYNYPKNIRCFFLQFILIL